MNTAFAERIFLAESKVRFFEDKYSTNLARLDADGLPNNADFELHQDYIMWHHWADVADQIKGDIVTPPSK